MPRKYDFWLHFTVLILVIFGSLMISTTSVGNTLVNKYSVITTIVKQTVFVIVSYGIMIFLANNFTMVRARKYGKIIGILLIVACVSTLFFKSVNGSKAWIRFPGFTIQPSEFVKVFMMVIIAVYVEIAGRRKFDCWTIIKIPFCFYCIYAGIVMLGQRDLGTFLIISLITVVVFLIPSHKNLRKFQNFVKVALVVASSVLVFLITPTGVKVMDKLPVFQHVSTRFEIALNPFTDPYGDGYQLIQGMVGISNGGIMGSGMGQSVQKYGFLTQADNDFILAIVIEELGVFGLAFIIIGYVVILQRLFHYAFRTKSEGYKIILIGTACYIFFHFFLNIGGVCGLIPLTGVPLLFISSGGSSLMSIMGALGISQAVISRIRRQGE